MNRNTFLVLIVLAIASHLILFGGAPLLLEAVAGLLLAGLLPGALFVEWLVGPLPRWERGLYSIGAGIAIMVLVMLFVSYLPGPVARWQTFVAFDLLILLGMVLLWRDKKVEVGNPAPPGDGRLGEPSQEGATASASPTSGTNRQDSRQKDKRGAGKRREGNPSTSSGHRREERKRGEGNPSTSSGHRPEERKRGEGNPSTLVPELVEGRQAVPELVEGQGIASSGHRREGLPLLVGCVLLLLVGGFFRFVNLDYAEFQGDEARATLRAAAVIQGYEDVLLIHKKGPTEILLPTVVYSLSGHLNEEMARFPFAVANLAGLFGLFLLGWRLFGPIAGWTAAMLLALDGYLIAFSRIVQYQSVVFLMSVLVVLILYRLYHQPSKVVNYLTLASLFLATGLLSHYEAIFAIIPAAYLLWQSLPMIAWDGPAPTPSPSPNTRGGEQTAPTPSPSQFRAAQDDIARGGEHPSLPSPSIGGGAGGGGPLLPSPSIGGGAGGPLLPSPSIGGGAGGGGRGRVWPYFLAIRTLIRPVVIGGALLAAFYVPFVRHPNFSATYTYLADRRIGGDFPYNNLVDFFIRTTLYSTTYYVVLMILLAMVALWLAYVRGLGTLGRLLGGVAIADLLLVVWRPDGLTFAGNDLTFLIFGLFLFGLWLMPRLDMRVRMLWLWFGIPLLIALFFTEKPRTHVYVFFIPWALLAGMIVQEGEQWLSERLGKRGAATTGVIPFDTSASSVHRRLRAPLATLAVAVFATYAYFGTYAYWYFIHNQVEVMRTWEKNRPSGFLVFYDEAIETGIFGFPFANGWKTVGALYQEGILAGSYETNEKDSWMPGWYTRGERRCARDAEWYFQADQLDELGWTEHDQTLMEQYLHNGGFREWGRVEINGQPRMTIYQRISNDESPPQPALISQGDWRATFDQNADPDFSLDYPVIIPKIAHPLHINLDNQIWLEGYDIQYDKPLKPGDTFELTLYWRAQRPIQESYKVFNQVYFGDSGMQAQLDGYPLCERRETWRWEPNELMSDSYQIPVKADASPGLYPLYSGMYLAESGKRLPVLDEAGNPVGDQIHITDIRIGEE